MESRKRRTLVRGLIAGGILLGAAAVLATVFIIRYGAHLTTPEINGYEGLYYAARLTLTGEPVARYSEDPPKFICFGREATDEEWKEQGVIWKERMGALGTALLDGRPYRVWHLSFTRWGGLKVFEEMTPEEVRDVVFSDVEMLCRSRYGCDGDVELASTFDELNILPHEREELALTLEEQYGVEIPDEALAGFETLEDLVGYIEDRL